MEKVYQTYERVTGKKWTGGNSPDVQATYKQYGITAPAGSAEANIALQEALNKSTTTVDPIKKTVGYASSTSKLGEYNQNSTTLDDKLNIKNNTTGVDTTTANKNGTSVGTDTTKNSGVVTGTDTNPKEPDAPDYLNANNILEQEKLKLDSEYEKKKENAQNLYKTKFASYDQAYSDDVLNINSVFETRINTQKRLDKLDIDRRKAYGSLGSAQYMPIEYTDAITNREREAADSLKRLDIERTSLLSKAKQARDSGQTNALRDLMNDVNNIEDRMRNQIREALTLAQTQNELAWKNYEREKAEFTKEMSERTKRAIMKFGDEYNKATTTEEKQAIIAKAIEANGGDPKNTQMLINMDSAFKANAETTYKNNITKEKDKLAIETSKTNNAKKIADMTKPPKQTVTEQNKVKNDAIANSILTLETAVKKNNWKGVDQTQYNTIKSLIKEEYGAKAVLDFEKQFKTKGLKVDKVK